MQLLDNDSTRIWMQFSVTTNTPQEHTSIITMVFSFYGIEDSNSIKSKHVTKIS
jgi:hypothetical protein